MREMLQSAGSSLGHQLEILANAEGAVFVRRDDGDAVRSALATFDRLEYYGLMVRIWSSLKEDEKAVLELINTPKMTTGEDGKKIADSFTVSREMRHSQVRDGDGLSVTHLCRDEYNQLDGFVAVDDTVVHEWSTGEIAQRMSLTDRQVRTLIYEGNSKIISHPLYQQIKEDCDG